MVVYFSGLYVFFMAFKRFIYGYIYLKMNYMAKKLKTRG